jgi:thymidylate kinase
VNKSGFSIVLEGNECNYKTTVANKLSNYFGFDLVKGSSFELATGSNEDLFNHFKSISLKQNIVIDRFIYSNLIYATLYPKYTIITSEQAIELEEQMNKNNFIVIHLYSNDEAIKERLLERGDEYIKKEEISKINEMHYDKFINNKTDTFVINIDTTKKTSDQVFKEILKELSIW